MKHFLCKLKIYSQEALCYIKTTFSNIVKGGKSIMKKVLCVIKKSFLCIIRGIWEFLKEKFKYILKNTWFCVLLLVGFCYVLKNYDNLGDFSTLNVHNIIFIVWIILLLFPLFSEMEFLGVKVKKEVEKATEEIRNSLNIMKMQITNSFSPKIYIGGTPFVVEKEINEQRNLVKQIRKDEKIPDTEENIAFKFSEDESGFINIRKELAKSLYELCNKIGYGNEFSIDKILQILNQLEMINGTICDLIKQIFRITDRIVHGESVSEEYKDFVIETYPVIKKKLNDAESNLKYITCPRCKYSGYSTYWNMCPHCGYISDDD